MQTTKIQRRGQKLLGMIRYLSKFIPRYAVLTAPAPLRRLTGKYVPFAWGPEEDAAFQRLKNNITNDDTMTYFDPRKPIVVRTEASFHEGLSAGLFQRTSKGLQPVHSISRSMTTADKKLLPNGERCIGCGIGEIQI